MPPRTVIIGNSGSGKSHLARSLSTIFSYPVIHLDRLFWMPGGFNEKRPKDEIKNGIEQKRKEASWIVEGVFGELAEMFYRRLDLSFFWTWIGLFVTQDFWRAARKAHSSWSRLMPQKILGICFIGPDNIGRERICALMQDTINYFPVLPA